MKKQIRILGIDDGPFTFHDRYCTVIGVVMRGGSYLECILRNQVTIDGEDATQTLIDMITHTRYHKQLKAIMLDGIALGGFNIVDIEELYDKTTVPIITITRDKPNYNKIKQALKDHFTDWKHRYQHLHQHGSLNKINTLHNPIYIKCVGIPLEHAQDIIKLSTIRGVIPEPLRIAHLIASGITRGESYGKA